MSYGEYVELSNAKAQSLFGGRELCIEDIEEMFWEKISTDEKYYAIDNQLSLFGEETKIWNLDQFTSAQSNIHWEKTHHEVKVSVYFGYYLIRLSYDVICRTLWKVYIRHLSTSASHSRHLVFTRKTAI